MYNIKSKKAVKLEAVTFSELGMQENDIEEILRCSIDMLYDDEESIYNFNRSKIPEYDSHVERKFNETIKIQTNAWAF